MSKKDIPDTKPKNLQESVPLPDIHTSKVIDGLSLTESQGRLYDEIMRVNSKLAEMYLGSLYTIRRSDNPERFSQAAHSIRELLEKLPISFKLDTKALAERLGSEVNNLQDRWQPCVSKSICYQEGKWGGDIDYPLKDFLRKAGAFFIWYSEHRPRRKAVIAETISKMDPSGYELPKPLVEPNIEIWSRIWDFFIDIAHHRRTANEKEFMSYLNQLERFLYSRMLPMDSKSKEVIDKILENNRNA